MRTNQTWERLRRKSESVTTSDAYLRESPYQEALIRLWANYRRKVSSQEVRQLIIQMAEELRKQGYKPGQIAKKLAQETPYSEPHIRRLLPKEFKLSTVESKEKNEILIPRSYDRDLSVSGKDAGSEKEEDEVERVEEIFEKEED